MSDRKLFLFGATKGGLGTMEWCADDYDLRDGAPNVRSYGRKGC